MRALTWLLEHTPWERTAEAYTDDPDDCVWEWVRPDVEAGLISLHPIALRMTYNGQPANTATMVTAWLFEDGSAVYVWRSELFVVPDVSVEVEVLHECHLVNH
jgi:hypothetical protein